MTEDFRLLAKYLRGDNILVLQLGLNWMKTNDIRELAKESAISDLFKAVINQELKYRESDEYKNKRRKV